MTANDIFYLGIGIIIFSVIMIVISIISYLIRKNKLTDSLNKEYGDE